MARPMSKKAWAKHQEEVAAYHDERRRWYAVDQDGNRSSQGDKVTTVRGEKMEFDMISAFPTFGKTGKVVVIDPTVPKGEWFRSRECYPSVINVELRREADQD